MSTPQDLTQDLTQDLSPPRAVEWSPVQDLLFQQLASDQPLGHDLAGIAELAARVCDVPMAMINLLTEETQHQIASVGVDHAICTRADSMCGQVIDERTLVVVPDARADPRFVDNPFVNGSFARVRFYASAPLLSGSGEVVGTLCVLDEEVRHGMSDKAQGLVKLAERVTAELGLVARTHALTTGLVQLDLIRAELAASNRRLSNLAREISHDLKTPLFGMEMSLELLQSELLAGADRDNALSLVERALRGSRRAGAAVQELLERVELASELRATPVDLDDLVNEVLVELAADLAGLTIHVDQLPTVNGNRDQLAVVIRTLLAHAAEHRHPHRAPRIEVSATGSTHGYRIQVADNGPGQLVGLRRAAGGGLGLGLRTCQRIIELHGGDIGLMDTPGGGTTVWFELAR